MDEEHTRGTIYYVFLSVVVLIYLFVHIFVMAKTQKTENSNLHGFEVHRPSSKGTKLLLQVIKAIINQYLIYASSNYLIY